MTHAFYPQQAPIDAYGNGGFRFADMSHRGSILCLPSGIYAWEKVHHLVDGRHDLSLAMFDAILAEADGIEVLLVGTGAAQIFLAPEVRDGLAARGLVAEAMATGAAARTYNVLLAEQRAIAAALIAVE